MDGAQMPASPFRIRPCHHLMNYKRKQQRCACASAQSAIHKNENTNRFFCCFPFHLKRERVNNIQRQVTRIRLPRWFQVVKSLGK